MYEALLEKIKKANYIAIVTHKAPDGDTIGSALGLYHSFLIHGIKSVVVNNDEVPRSLKYLNGVEKIKKEIPNAADLVLVVDTGSTKKIGVDLKEKEIVTLDHHLSNEGFGTINIVEPDAASTGEVAYKFLKFAEFTINRPSAEALYAAIATDTQFFTTNRVKNSTFEAVEELYSIGVDHVRAISNLKNSMGLSEMRLFGEVLRSFELINSGSIIYCEISKDLLDSCGANFSDTSEIADFLLCNVTCRMVIILIEMPFGVKGSFRSKDEIDVTVFAHKLNGGGHRNAAGFVLKTSLEKAKDEVLEVVNA